MHIFSYTNGKQTKAWKPRKYFLLPQKSSPSFQRIKPLGRVVFCHNPFKNSDTKLEHSRHYFMKRGILTDKEGKEYADNGERAIFYARGVLETVKKLGWRPDIIHCYGWAAALAPFYIKQAYYDEPSFRDAKVVMEVSPKEFEKDLGVENAKFVEYKDAHYADVKELCSEAYGHTEMEKIGVKFADGVIIENNDVDPSIIEYAKSLGRPILDPVEGDDFNEIYNAFYRKIAEESNN